MLQHTRQQGGQRWAASIGASRASQCCLLQTPLLSDTLGGADHWVMTHCVASALYTSRRPTHCTSSWRRRRRLRWRTACRTAWRPRCRRRWPMRRRRTPPITASTSAPCCARRPRSAAPSWCHVFPDRIPDACRVCGRPRHRRAAVLDIRQHSAAGPCACLTQLANRHMLDTSDRTMQ